MTTDVHNPSKTSPRVLAVCTGTVKPLFVKEGEKTMRTTMSAIDKRAISSLETPTPAAVHLMGIEGDEQANPSVHGGRDKAVYMMPIEHYGFWEGMRQEKLGKSDPLHAGFLGENLTIEGLLEHEVFMGDEMRIGSAVFSVTDPREPCFKFNGKMGYTHAAKHMTQKGNCGWYLRVVVPGEIQAGDAIEVVPGPRLRTIAQQFAFINKKVIKELFD